MYGGVIGSYPLQYSELSVDPGTTNAYDQSANLSFGEKFKRFALGFLKALGIILLVLLAVCAAVFLAMLLIRQYNLRIRRRLRSKRQKNLPKQPSAPLVQRLPSPASPIAPSRSSSPKPKKKTYRPVSTQKPVRPKKLK